MGRGETVKKVIQVPVDEGLLRT